MSWSPTIPFHKESKFSCTLSWTTTLDPEDSSKRTAPRPPTPPSQDPSVNTSTVLVLMLNGIVLGWILFNKTRTSSHQSLKLLYVGVTLVNQGEDFEAAVFQRSPCEISSCEVQQAMNLLRFGQVQVSCVLDLGYLRGNLLHSSLLVLQGHRSGLPQACQIHGHAQHIKGR